MTVRMPALFGGRAAVESAVRVLVTKNKQMEVWVHKDDVMVVLEYLYKEVDMKGVGPLPDEESQEETPKTSVWWDRRDFAWCARATDATGQTHRLTKCVPRKDRLTGKLFSVSQFLAEKICTRERVDYWLTTHQLE